MTSQCQNKKQKGDNEQMDSSQNLIIMQVDEFTVQQISKIKDIDKQLCISDEKGYGYISAKIETLKKIRNNNTLMSDLYLSGLIDQIAYTIKDISPSEPKSTRIPTVHILSKNNFIKNVKMNYPADKISGILNKHIGSEE